MLFLQHILNGLLAGSYYLLIALGLSLIFSLGGIVNLAHGAFYAIGAYLAITIGQRLGFTAAVFMAPIAVGILGVIVERLLLRRFYKADPALRSSSPSGLMVAEQALRMIYGAPCHGRFPWRCEQFIVADFFYPNTALMIVAAVCRGAVVPAATHAVGRACARACRT